MRSARIGEFQGRAEIIQRKIGEANARLAALQSELANLEAGEQRERDYTRKLEIESRREAIKQESDQNWANYAAKQEALEKETAVSRWSSKGFFRGRTRQCILARVQQKDSA